MDRKLVRLNGVVGFYPAATVGDDIEIYEPENDEDALRGGTIKSKFHGLRQQVCCLMYTHPCMRACNCLLPVLCT
jgi:cobalamin-dependent methionine synthase I